jgi:hypothetical protein
MATLESQACGASDDFLGRANMAVLNPDFDYPHDFDTASFVTSIERALINCMDVQELVRHLTHNFVHPYTRRDKLITRLRVIVENDPTQIVEVRDAVAVLLALGDDAVAAPQRPGLDATLKGLAQLLPPDEQMALAPEFLFHRRAARRRTGALMVGTHPESCPPTMKQVLLAAFKQWRDSQVLTPLSRVQTDLGDIAPWLLDALSDLPDPGQVNRPLQEQARVFERLLTTDLARAAELAERYPTAFVYGVGRAGRGEAAPFVIRILVATRKKRAQAARLSHRLLIRSDSVSSVRRHVVWAYQRESADCIRLAIWALGKLKARDALQDIALDYGTCWFEDIGSEYVDVNEE